LIFQRKHYAKGYAKLLRQAFVYDVPISIHDELHATVIHDIPRPSDAEIRDMYRTYLAHKDLIDQCDMLTVCEWLATACKDKAWQACMLRQYYFLKEKMGG
jgi:hypothetical protein